MRKVTSCIKKDLKSRVLLVQHIYLSLYSMICTFSPEICKARRRISMCVWEKNFVWTFSISKNLNKRINIVNLQTKLATEKGSHNTQVQTGPASWPSILSPYMREVYRLYWGEKNLVFTVEHCHEKVIKSCWDMLYPINSYEHLAPSGLRFNFGALQGLSEIL